MDYEKAFSQFIDRREYDKAQQELFDIVRHAFRAGWLAAEGYPPEPQNVVSLIKNGDLPDKKE